MARKRSSGLLHWVTVRNEDTGEPLNSWSYTDMSEAHGKKMEQEEALDPPGIQTDVAIETWPPGMFPQKIKTGSSEISYGGVPWWEPDVSEMSLVSFTMSGKIQIALEAPEFLGCSTQREL